jgi:hypothetical protein
MARIQSDLALRHWRMTPPQQFSLEQFDIVKLLAKKADLYQRHVLEILVTIPGVWNRGWHQHGAPENLA